MRLILAVILAAIAAGVVLFLTAPRSAPLLDAKGDKVGEVLASWGGWWGAGRPPDSADAVNLQVRGYDGKLEYKWDDGKPSAVTPEGGEVSIPAEGTTLYVRPEGGEWTKVLQLKRDSMGKVEWIYLNGRAHQLVRVHSLSFTVSADPGDVVTLVSAIVLGSLAIGWLLGKRRQQRLAFFGMVGIGLIFAVSQLPPDLFKPVMPLPGPGGLPLGGVGLAHIGIAVAVFLIVLGVALLLGGRKKR